MCKLRSLLLGWTRPAAGASAFYDSEAERVPWAQNEKARLCPAVASPPHPAPSVLGTGSRAEPGLRQVLGGLAPETSHPRPVQLGLAAAAFPRACFIRGADFELYEAPRRHKRSGWGWDPVAECRSQPADAGRAQREGQHPLPVGLRSALGSRRAGQGHTAHSEKVLSRSVSQGAHRKHSCQGHSEGPGNPRSRLPGSPKLKASTPVLG